MKIIFFLITSLLLISIFTQNLFAELQTESHFTKNQSNIKSQVKQLKTDTLLVKTKLREFITIGYLFKPNTFALNFPNPYIFALTGGYTKEKYGLYVRSKFSLNMPESKPIVGVLNPLMIVSDLIPKGNLKVNNILLPNLTITTGIMGKVFNDFYLYFGGGLGNFTLYNEYGSLNNTPVLVRNNKPSIDNFTYDVPVTENYYKTSTSETRLELELGAHYFYKKININFSNNYVSGGSGQSSYSVGIGYNF